MKRCAVIIGVNKTEGLPLLEAAVSGANDFAEWTKSQNIDTTLLTDEKAPVRLNDITSAIKDFVDKQIYSQIMIFFSGHGILKGPDQEIWLLTESLSNSNEAINTVSSTAISRNSGIPHIIFISDACRSLPEEQGLSQVLGGIIFPNRTPTDYAFQGDFLGTISDGFYRKKIDNRLFTLKVTCHANFIPTTRTFCRADTASCHGTWFAGASPEWASAG